MKKNDKAMFYNLKKRIVFTALFGLVVLWLCISKMICKA
jgi:hypothetical protein